MVPDGSCSARTAKSSLSCRANVSAFLIPTGREIEVGDGAGDEAREHNGGEAGVLALPAPEIERIPQGSDFEIQGLVQQYIENEVTSDSPRRCMATPARVSQDNGRIEATTRTWTRQPWWGLAGGVCVLSGG